VNVDEELSRKKRNSDDYSNFEFLSSDGSGDTETTTKSREGNYINPSWGVLAILETN
jgi:hypothetical protein